MLSKLVIQAKSGQLTFIHLEPDAEWELNIKIGDEFVVAHVVSENAVQALLKVLPPDMIRCRKLLESGKVRHGLFVETKTADAYRFGRITDEPSFV